MKTNPAAAIALVVVLGGAAYFHFGASTPADAVAAAGVAARGAADPVVEQPAPRTPDTLAVPRKSTPALNFESSLRYDELFAAALPLAEAGDAEAMDTIAKVLEYCFVYSLSPGNFASQLETLTRMKPANAAALQRVGEKVSSRCERVNGGSPITLDQKQEWLSRAAEAGNLSATVRLALQDPLSSTDAEGRQQLLDAVKASRDPSLILESASLMTPQSLEERTSTPDGIGSQDDVLALQLAACRLGAPCAAGNNLMDAMCLNGGACQYASYEELVINEAIPPARRDAFNQKVGANMAGLDQ